MTPATNGVTGGTADLRRLAASFGVQLRYRDALKRWRAPTDDALIAILRSLGAEITRPADARHALAARESARAERLTEPVLVARAGRSKDLFMSLDPATVRGA